MNEIDLLTITQAKRGDQSAFKRIYDCYAPLVWKVAYRTVCADAALAKEIVQEVFVRLHKFLKKFKGDAKLSTWIFRIAYNAAMSCEGKRRKRAPSESEIDKMSIRAAIDEEVANRELMRKILCTLSADERFLLIARELNGLSYDELAAVCGKNEGALRTSLHRLKQRIREEFYHVNK